MPAAKSAATTSPGAPEPGALDCVRHPHPTELALLGLAGLAGAAGGDIVGGVVGKVMGGLEGKLPIGSEGDAGRVAFQSPIAFSMTLLLSSMGVSPDSEYSTTESAPGILSG
jgi:hypothetical protein